MSKMQNLLHFGGRKGFSTRDLSTYQKTLRAIRDEEKKLGSFSDAALVQLADKFRKQLKKDAGLLLPGVFALVSEVAARKLNMRPYDVQILGALAMNEGKIIEMNTGEGKTLVATMPACFQILSGNHVHVLTFNDYLAKRDARWMGPVYEFLGISVGYIQGGMKKEERKESYRNDVTYLTAKQGGFDYLRSFLAGEPGDMILPNAGFAIVDEVDSILIDEARTPLVIAGKDTNMSGIDLYRVADAVNKLERGKDFETDEYQLNIYLTERGIKNVETELQCENLYEKENEDLLVRVNQALHAGFLLHKDVDYIVLNEAIELIDEFTGRVVEDRKWPHGLQASIEAKEKIPITEEGRILGKTTLPHYINSYPKICGMTGTALQAAEEFYEIYNLPVVVIPPNKPCQRIDREDFIFPDKDTKYKALMNEIQYQNQSGRPVLVGTFSVQESEFLAQMLERELIDCEVLNARNDEEEAAIIARAGMPGAVTISTNMAGRGTDIKLGGDNETDKNKILEQGGLLVIGTNRFESQRIDNQLRGRAGRQGDPGESRFFISLEDDLLVKHGIRELLPKRFRVRKSISSMNSSIIRREINRTQRIIEGKNLDIRNTLIKYASLVETQREIIYQRRQRIMEEREPSFFHSKAPNDYILAISKYGEPALRTVERKISLAVIDKCWSDFLEETDQIRQGIYLVASGGLNPYVEFQKLMDSSFKKLLEKMDQDIIQAMNQVEIKDGAPDMRKLKLEAPGSTWTYLISDNPFGDRLEMMLGGNIGFGAFAALNWPLLAIYFLLKRLFTKNKDQ